MKKLVLLSLMVMCLPFVGVAQNWDDDLYYTPKEDNNKQVEKPVRNEVQRAPATQVVVPSGTTVVVRDRQGNARDVDEYNRRYDSRDNTFTMEEDTLVVQEKDYADRGEWVNGFDGTQDDYEYAMRLVRFRNPRFAIPISSPLYWDVVYGANSWDWNVYDDGFYAYAFPTYTNSLWWDWRFNSFGMGFGWNSPYYGWGGYYPGYWGGYWGSSWGPSWGWGHHHHHHGWYDPWYGGNHWAGTSYYNNRRPGYGTSSGRPSTGRPTTGGSYSRPSMGSSSSRPTVGSSVRPGSGSSSSVRPSSSSRPSSTTPGRVVGTRPSYSGSSEATTRPGSSSSSGSVSSRPSSSGRYEGTSSSGSRPSGSYTRPSSGSSSGSSGYSRPSSTRNSSTYSPSESSTRSSGSYSRGSSSGSRPSSSGSSSRSYESTPSRSYSPSSSGSSYSRPSGGSYSGGSRSSSGGGGSSRPSGGRR